MHGSKCNQSYSIATYSTWTSICIISTNLADPGTTFLGSNAFNLDVRGSPLRRTPDGNLEQLYGPITVMCNLVRLHGRPSAILADPMVSTDSTWASIGDPGGPIGFNLDVHRRTPWRRRIQVFTRTMALVFSTYLELGIWTWTGYKRGAGIQFELNTGTAPVV